MFKWMEGNACFSDVYISTLLMDTLVLTRLFACIEVAGKKSRSFWPAQNKPMSNLSCCIGDSTLECQNGGK